MLKFITGVFIVMSVFNAVAGSVVRWNNTPDILDQQFWQNVKNHPQYAALKARADEMLKEEIVSPLPLYLEFSRNKNRVNYEKRYFKYRHFGPLVVAYCVSGDKSYLKNIESRIRMLLSLPSWVLPAHDRELKAYRGEEMLVDLFSAMICGELSTVLYILNPVMDKDLAANLEKEIIRRSVIPMEDVISGKSTIDRFWWMNGSNNWNPVCKRGVISAMLRIGLEKERIDRILKLFFDHFEDYMQSFGNEGYCDEGLSYWGGSCGEYLLISAILKQYDNRDVLSSEPRMLKAVMYPENIMMAPGCFPAYTDCSITSRPSDFTLQLRDILLGRRKGFSDDLPLGDSLDAICLRLAFGRDNAPVEVKNSAPFTAFSSAGAYVARGSKDCPLSVSFKGGNNRESHNHNDIGTYIIAVDGTAVVLDPGGEIYTGRTFGPGRYESKLLNSFGHSVPVVDGRLQTNRVGDDAFNPPKNLTPVEDIQAVLLTEELSPDRVFVKFDISRVYNQVKGIGKLERSFLFERAGGGKFTVSDHGSFDREMDFEGAVITLGEIKELGGNRYLITEKGKSLLLEVNSSVPYKFTVHTIMEDTYHKRPVYRLTFTATEKCRNVDMSFVFTPAAK